MEVLTNLLKAAIKKLRAEKKIQKYNQVIQRKAQYNKASEGKKIAREKFLVGNAMKKIFAEMDADIMLKMITLSQSLNQKDRDFLLENVESRQSKNDLGLIFDYFDENQKNHQLQIKQINKRKIQYTYIHEYIQGLTKGLKITFEI